MNNKVLIVGGRGQLGIYLANLLLKKKYKVTITSRNPNKKKLYEINKNFKNFKPKVIKLDIFDKKKILIVLKKIKPDYIFYFAGQSSVSDSFQKKSETNKSNFNGCKNFLDQILKLNLKLKFFNSASVEIFGNKKVKIKINTNKKPVSPYGFSKLKSFKLVKKYRQKHNLQLYNGLLSNCESYLRPESFVIPKLCLAALKAERNKKKGITTKFYFGNINISRDWGWAEEYVKYIWKKINYGTEFDFIIATGQTFKLKDLIKFAFKNVNLDWKQHIIIDKKLHRKKEIFNVKISKINTENIIKTNGKSIIIKLLKFYKSRLNLLGKK